MVVTATRRKLTGAHYTPRGLADFVADQVVQALDEPAKHNVRVLDPACGDGVLLAAASSALCRSGWREFSLVGVEADAFAARAAAQRFRDDAHAQILEADFLSMATGSSESPNLFGSPPPDELGEPFDAIIANPPYVRTQHMGAARAQALSQRFGLNGRVDLYHAFIVATTGLLRVGGVLGIITSNRFLYTRSGEAVRRFLSERFDVLSIVDLGDTKLFEAAVLPAVLVGRRLGASRGSPRQGRFVKVYSRPAAIEPSDDDSTTIPAESVYPLLAATANGTYRLPQGLFDVGVGDLSISVDKPHVPWVMMSERERHWVERVRHNAIALIKDVARVRVGIKTTADSVFIRSDWNALPPQMRPEPELLRPIMTHDNARRWWPTASGSKVLYTYEASGGRRRLVDIGRFPCTMRYLEANRERLEARRYIRESERKWFELWVPQDPSLWPLPKVVCPDISPEARFYLDASGSIIDGDSYWIVPQSGKPPDVLYLLLGVANSSLMARYHDLAFNNRLYSGRRRYLTQYVENYPLPDPEGRASVELTHLVKEVIAQGPLDDTAVRQFESTLDSLTEQAFSVETSFDEGGR